MSRLPCERAARQAMAQDAKANVLEGFIVSSLDIALVSLLDGSEFLLDIANSVAQLPSFKYVLKG